jgi:Cdc6-like AAA superfamily ATPase
MLGFPDASREETWGHERSRSEESNITGPSDIRILSGGVASIPGGVVHPIGSSMTSPTAIPSLILQDLSGRPERHPPIPPVNVDATLEESLHTIRNSVVMLSDSLDSLSRRQDMHFTTEMLRMHEEVASLRATVHGLRMQVCFTFIYSDFIHGV